MDGAHKTITEKMKEALETICQCDVYMEVKGLNLGDLGRKDLAKAIIEYDSLARISGDSPEIKKLQEDYKDIRETYGLR